MIYIYVVSQDKGSILCAWGWGPVLHAWGRDPSCVLGERIYLVCWGKGSILGTGRRGLSWVLGEGIYLVCLRKGSILHTGERNVSCVLGEGIYLLCWGRDLSCVLEEYLSAMWQILASFKAGSQTFGHQIPKQKPLLLFSQNNLIPSWTSAFWLVCCRHQPAASAGRGEWTWALGQP